MRSTFRLNPATVRAGHDGGPRPSASHRIVAGPPAARWSASASHRARRCAPTLPRMSGPRAPEHPIRTLCAPRRPAIVPIQIEPYVGALLQSPRMERPRARGCESSPVSLPPEARLLNGFGVVPLRSRRQGRSARGPRIRSAPRLRRRPDAVVRRHAGDVHGSAASARRRERRATPRRGGREALKPEGS